MNSITAKNGVTITKVDYGFIHWTYQENTYKIPHRLFNDRFEDGWDHTYYTLANTLKNWSDSGYRITK